LGQNEAAKKKRGGVGRELRGTETRQQSYTRGLPTCPREVDRG